MPRIPLRPYWQTSDKSSVRLYQGDVVSVLKRMPSASVQCVVTSPPYWGLRDYGTDKSLEIGSEKTPDEFVVKMVAVFAEVRRVLRDDGVVWLNMGDTYASGGGGFKEQKAEHFAYLKHTRRGLTPPGLKSGNLVGVPWRLALALQADGWILRQDIIWAKPSPMPESVRNRCTKSHEYIFLLVKKMGYFYDVEAVRELHKEPERGKKHHESRNPHSGRLDDMSKEQAAFTVAIREYNPAGRNKRSVWTVEDHKELLEWLAENEPKLLGEFMGQSDNKLDVWNVASESYAGAHFATFPRKLITPCILAGTSEHGACTECGTPWKRITEEKKLKRYRPNEYVKRTGVKGTGNVCANTVAGVDVKTIGWEPTCGCNTDRVVPCAVLDPFVGSGTTCCVAVAHGRRSIGIDLSVKYLENNAIPRIEGELLERPVLAHLLNQK